MTDYVELVDVTGVATRVVDTTNDDTLTIKQGVVIQTSLSAYQFSGGRLSATIGGTVAAGRSYDGLIAGTFVSGGADTGGNSRLGISASGVVTGAVGAALYGGLNRVTNAGLIDGRYFGVFLTGYGNSVVNTGVISSGRYGVFGFADEAGTTVAVTNTGVISAGYYGLHIGGRLTVTNSGTISAFASSANAVRIDGTQGGTITNLDTGVISAEAGGDAVRNFSSGVLTIVNHGQITGTIRMGSNADSYDGTLGRMTGAILGQGGNDTIAGGAGRELIDGGSGNDDLDGGGGNDAFVAGDNDGDDTYDGGAGIDRISFAGVTTGGVAVDIAGQSAGGISPGNIGNDTILNIEQIIGTGFVDSLFGDASANQFYGGGGGDTLVGFDGNDRLFGDAGTDNIIGGLGRDYLTGGADADTFRYQAVSDSSFGAATRDLILDFVSDADVIANPLLVADTINLSAIDADGNSGNGNQAFTFIGYNNGAAPAFTGVAGQLRTYTNAAGVTFAEGDTNGDLTPDLQIQIFGTHTMAASDFVL